MSKNYEKRWSAPGSLLIAGEYLVTEEGGRGLALAAGGRGLLSTSSIPSREYSLEMESLCPGGGGKWNLKTARDESSLTGTSLASAVWEEYSKSDHPADEKKTQKIIVDTRIFFDLNGRKLGYGSSAAAALLFTQGLEALTADDDTVDIDVKRTAGRALQAHRSWQNGRGSGYDVLSSAYGGAGLFTGGLKPAWEPLQWPDVFDCWIIKGPGAVSSSHAVDCYKVWKQKTGNHRVSTQLLLELSLNLEQACRNIHCRTKSDSDDFLKTIHQLAILGSRLGDEISVPAFPVMPDGFLYDDLVSRNPWYRPGSGAAKCLGAGNETILLIAYKDGLSSRENAALIELKHKGSAHPLSIEAAGLSPEDSL